MKFSKKTFLFLFAVILISLVLEPIIKSVEGFSGINNDITGHYPISVDKPILNDYPLVNKKNMDEIKNNSVSNIWRDFPVFSLPSFKQITNNFKYYKNNKCLAINVNNQVQVVIALALLRVLPLLLVLDVDLLKNVLVLHLLALQVVLQVPLQVYLVHPQPHYPLKSLLVI